MGESSCDRVNSDSDLLPMSTVGFGGLLIFFSRGDSGLRRCYCWIHARAFVVQRRFGLGMIPPLA